MGGLVQVCSAWTAKWQVSAIQDPTGFGTQPARCSAPSRSASNATTTRSIRSPTNRPHRAVAADARRRTQLITSRHRLPGESGALVHLALVDAYTA